ncbi:hypothetical protein M5689_017131 [Euphorbia peplus]|nr:hypothetical protein M5689_017131 [Euphorbia peplus]
MEDDDDEEVFYGDLKNSPNLQLLNLDLPTTPKSYSKLWSMVVVKDPPSPTKIPDEPLSVFPPCNHENLTPSHFNPEPKTHLTPPSFPSPPLSFFPPDSSPAPVVVSPLTEWWVLTVKILRSGMANVGSYFRCYGYPFWSFGNVAVVVTVVSWWLYARARRQWRRRNNVDHLMQIITQKDEKIMQLLSQISKMNEVLLTRHKALTSQLAD